MTPLSSIDINAIVTKYIELSKIPTAKGAALALMIATAYEKALTSSTTTPTDPYFIPNRETYGYLHGLTTRRSNPTMLRLETIAYAPTIYPDHMIATAVMTIQAAFYDQRDSDACFLSELLDTVLVGVSLEAPKHEPYRRLRPTAQQACFAISDYIDARSEAAKTVVAPQTGQAPAPIKSLADLALLMAAR